MSRFKHLKFVFSCQGKMRHESFAAAKRYLISDTQAYECKFCKGWHVGHTRDGGKSKVKYWQLKAGIAKTHKLGDAF